MHGLNDSSNNNNNTFDGVQVGPAGEEVLLEIQSEQIIPAVMFQHHV